VGVNEGHFLLENYSALPTPREKKIDSVDLLIINQDNSIALYSTDEIGFCENDQNLQINSRFGGSH